jgi:hypothetical protein
LVDFRIRIVRDAHSAVADSCANSRIHRVLRDGDIERGVRAMCARCVKTARSDEVIASAHMGECEADCHGVSSRFRRARFALEVQISAARVEVKRSLEIGLGRVHSIQEERRCVLRRSFTKRKIREITT